MSEPVNFSVITLIGLGLIGGSMARAVKQKLPQVKIVGFDSRSDFTEYALKEKFIDEAADNLKESVKQADCVFICAPIGAYGAIAETVIPAMKKGAILSDVGSVKKEPIAVIEPLLSLNKDMIFIPGHPVAGTEKSGVGAGFADLFEKKRIILTPLPDTPDTTLNALTVFWNGLGGVTEIMEPERHDLVFALVSHLPHLIAYNIVGTAAHLEKVTESEVIRFSASGFRDFTRLAASDPTVWRDVFLNNREAVLEILGRFTEDLFDLQRAIRYKDGEKLFNLFTRTQKIRKEIIEAGQDTDKANFGRDK